MIRLHTVPFSQLPDPHYECIICGETALTHENRYKKLAYLDLASRPRYLVHIISEAIFSARSHGWCFSRWAQPEVSNNRLPRCFHCNLQVARLDGKKVQSIFKPILSDLVRQFIWASFVGNLPKVEELVLNKHIRDNGLEHALMLAAGAGHFRITEVLLANGGWTISERGLGAAVVSAATSSKNPDVLELLLRNGPISKEDRGDALYSASRKGHLLAVHKLLLDGPVSPLALAKSIFAARFNARVLKEIIYSDQVVDIGFSFAAFTAGTIFFILTK